MAGDKGPFDEALEFFARVVKGLETGVVKALVAAPLLIRQEFETQSKRKLNTSRDDYLAALNIDLKGGVIIVELAAENWLAQAVEDGASAFDLHKMLQTSQKVKVSKKGHRFMTIPMGKTKSSTLKPGTSVGQALDQKIRDALSGKPRWTIPYTSQGADGTVTSAESMITKDPDLLGLSRIRRYQNPEDVPKGKRPISSQFILFRKISENPLSKSYGRWRHPGIEGRGLFPIVETWANTTLIQIIEKIIIDSVDKEMKS